MNDNDNGFTKVQGRKNRKNKNNHLLSPRNTHFQVTHLLLND